MAKEPNQCVCYATHDAAAGRYVPCGALTARRFAPGHDARFKGVLQRLHVQGVKYEYVDNDGLQHAVDPMEYAREIGWSGHLRAAEQRAKDKANRPKRVRTAKPDAEAVKVKIGRSKFEGVVTGKDGDQVTVAYKDKDGKRHVATVDASKVEPLG